MAVFRVQPIFCADIGKAVPVLSAFVQCQRVFLTGYRVRDFYGFPCIFGFGACLMPTEVPGIVQRGHAAAESVLRIPAFLPQYS